MAVTAMPVQDEQDVPQALIRALFRQPSALETVLGEADLTPRDVAMWARRLGAGPDIEKLAGWLAVGQQPGAYRPLLEVAASHLRAGEPHAALPVFRWAYHAWRSAPDDGRRHEHGLKLLARWGQCLYQLERRDEARDKWLWALQLVSDEQGLRRLVRVMEEAGAAEVSQSVLTEARWRRLPGAEALARHRQRLAELTVAAPRSASEAAPAAAVRGDVAVVADVANLDMVCGEQYGFHRRLDYGRLLGVARQAGHLRVRLAFVPDIPETLAVRQHLADVGFEVDLQRPKRTNGRVSANADAAIAAAAVRWASEPDMARVELWTGDGDFLKVRDVIRQAWPSVAVVFRGFEAGTAAAIQRLESDWEPIDVECLT